MNKIKNNNKIVIINKFNETNKEDIKSKIENAFKIFYGKRDTWKKGHLPKAG